jgi:hypothetical protein
MVVIMVSQSPMMALIKCEMHMCRLLAFVRACCSIEKRCDAPYSAGVN